MLFLDFNLPSRTTWFYLSLMLAIGLFFKFNRFFNLRNWDIVALYLLVPGFLLLPEGARFAGQAVMDSQTLYGFIWLIAGSGWFFLRCLLDMTLVSRPAMAPNLNLAGLAWLGPPTPR